MKCGGGKRKVTSKAFNHVVVVGSFVPSDGADLGVGDGGKFMLEGFFL